jgi:selenocysteine lyase/cysteine desulfurase
MPASQCQLPLDLVADFSRFRSNLGDRLHFAAHSHHFWPDVTRDAHLQCWDDAARLSDRKWTNVLDGVWKDVRSGICGHLNLPRPDTLVPAPNTHELVSRLLSCLPIGRPARILTTASEFHSFRRQCARLIEAGALEATIVDAEPFDSFAERFVAAGRNTGPFDLAFFSQTFFDSGFVNTDLSSIVAELDAHAELIVIDGYHGYLASPTDLAAIAERAFYLAGGYKYAMAGEGACFMHCPPGIAPRPLNTGWYAGFGNLSGRQDGVDYDPSGWRFMGSTFDPSGLYRMRASLDWIAAHELTADIIHGHARYLQDMFLSGLRHFPACPLKIEDLLLDPSTMPTGNFLTFATGNAGELFQLLQSNGIDVDYRADRLRIGFGLYHCTADVEQLLLRLSQVTG